MYKTDEWGGGCVWGPIGDEQVKGVQWIGASIGCVRYVPKGGGHEERKAVTAMVLPDPRRVPSRHEAILS